MATQDPRSPDEGGESSPISNPANMHFFRPNDGIYVSEGPEQRTICVSPHLPPAMARNGDWHVEQFELHKELYRGKTSLLYMATDRISNIQVALKLYRKRKLSVLNRYQVEREVRLHINLHHENIIHLFAAFEDEKHVYMVQEFAVCGDLFEDLKKGGGQLKEKTAVRDVIVPFLSALAYLHNQGIIHRDIKPENILLGANKVIKVADFGLSININHERPVTRAGTLDYMAPEVLVCPDKRRPDENKDKILLGYTAQVDSWAVGILAYELLVGYPPFEQESRAATYEHIMYKEPKYPSWMTEDAKKFIGLALCKNATQRPTVFDLMQHTWVQPYIMRHLLPATSSIPGPSRLRHSVSHAAGEDMRDTTLHSSSSNGMLVPPPGSTSSSGMAPGPPTVPGGQAGRMFMPAAAAPHPHAASSAALSNSGAAQQSQGQMGTEVGNMGNRNLQQQKGNQSHGSQHHMQLQMHQQHASPQAVPTPPPSQRPVTLKTSISLQAAATPGANEPITGVSGEGGRLHDSISDPTTRAFEAMQNPHPPGASASASLYGPQGSRSGGGGAEIDRQASHSPVISNSGAANGVGAGNGNGIACSNNNTSASGGLVPPRTAPSAMSGSASGNLTARLAHANTHLPHGGHNSPPMHGPRSMPPPLMLEPTALEGSIIATHDVGSLIPAVSVGGPLPYHAADTIMPLSPSSHPRSATALYNRLSLPPGQGQASPVPPGSAPPRQRMAGLVPPVNVSSSFMGHFRMPAPPISPKPHTPELSSAFHRPASGVLSDDSFMVPVRTPSISVGVQMLSPLQAQLLAPRPSSRLNSPSHSRRNSISQAGQAPQSLGPTTSMQQQYLSTPLPQLSADYGEGVFPEDPSGPRASNNYRTGPAPLSVNTSSKAFSKVWGSGREGGNGNSDSALDGTNSGGNSFSRAGGGGGTPVSPLVRGSVANRVRMLTPDEPRPLMRESSVSMSFKSGGGSGSGLMRDDIGQQSMTVYHRPGKVPGVGRAALAARDADGMGEGASGGVSPLGHLHMNSPGLSKAKSLVARNHNNGMMDDGASLARLGSDMVLARTAAGIAAGSPAGMVTQRSFTAGNSAIARKLAHGAIATKVTEYVKGRIPHEDEGIE